MIDRILGKIGRTMERPARDPEKEIESARVLHAQVLRERRRILNEFRKIEQSLK